MHALPHSTSKSPRQMTNYVFILSMRGNCLSKVKCLAQGHMTGQNTSSNIEGKKKERKKNFRYKIPLKDVGDKADRV